MNRNLICDAFTVYLETDLVTDLFICQHCWTMEYEYQVFLNPPIAVILYFYTDAIHRIQVVSTGIIYSAHYRILCFENIHIHDILLTLPNHHTGILKWCSPASWPVQVSGSLWSLMVLYWSVIKTYRH